MEKTIIPDDRTRTSMFSAVGDKLNEQVRYKDLPRFHSVIILFS